MQCHNFVTDGELVASAHTDYSVRLWAAKLVTESGGFSSLNGKTPRNITPVTFSEDDLNRRGNPDATLFAFFDLDKKPIIGDWSYIDDEGWMRNRLDADKSSDDPLLFWLPPVDRFGFWWPKDSVVISKNVVTVSTSVSLYMGRNGRLLYREQHRQ